MALQLSKSGSISRDVNSNFIGGIREFLSIHVYLTPKPSRLRDGFLKNLKEHLIIIK